MRDEREKSYIKKSLKVLILEIRYKKFKWISAVVSHIAHCQIKTRSQILYILNSPCVVLPLLNFKGLQKNNYILRIVSELKFSHSTRMQRIFHQTNIVNHWQNAVQWIVSYMNLGGTYYWNEEENFNLIK